MNQMEKDENIISNAFKDKNLVSKYDTNIISSIQRYLNKLYTSLWNNFYYKAEKDQFFSSLLSSQKEEEKQQNKDMIIMNEDEDENEEKNKKKEEEKKENEFRKNVIENSINLYLENFKFEEELNVKNENEEANKKENKIFKVIEDLGANPIDIILGLQLPGIYPIISYIIKRSHSEITKGYAINEGRLRKYIKDLNVQNEKTRYEQKLKTLNDQLKIDLEKIERINKIPKNEMEKNEFTDSLLEDYYTIFIYNNLGNYIGNNNDKYNFDLNDLKNMLKFLVGQRNKIFGIEKNDMESIAGNINWIEYYYVEISYILKIYLMLSNYENNISGKIEGFVNNDLLIYENSERCKEYTSKVNKALFLGFESLLKIITSNVNLYLGLTDKNKFSKFIDMNKEILNQVNKFNINLKLYLKELLSLQEILGIIDCLNANGKCAEKNLKNILSYFSKTGDDDKAENFDQLYASLEEILGKDKSYYKLTSLIFKNEFNKNNNDENFKKKITEIITSNNEYILNNYQLLKIILDFDYSPSQIKDNLVKIKDDENLLKIINNNCNKEYLEQSIFNAYDYLLYLYFTKTSTNIKALAKSKKITEDVKLFEKLSTSKSDTGIVFELSLKIFGDCLKFLDEPDYKKDKNIDLAKLFSISYIKSYLGHLVNFSMTKEQELGGIEEIIKIINGRDNAFRKVVKIYIIKLFYNSKDTKDVKGVNKNYDNLFTINFRQKGYDFIQKMLEDENEKQNLREMVEEKCSPDNPKYKDYPYFKYFVYTINKKDESESFKKQIKDQKDCIDKYPIIYKYLAESESNDKKLSVLKHVEKYNEFCNFMIDNYSFKITREEAKKEKLNDQQIIKKITEKQQKNNLVSGFFEAWKDIGPKAIQYKSNKKMEPKSLTEEDTLVFFLNDINESGFGMYIAAGYEYLIKLQNEFINFIIEHGQDKPYLKFYFENMKNKIPVYEANNNQILLIYHIYKISEYKFFTDLVNTFTKRKIYNQEGKIDYLHYNEFEFDFQAIEEELSRLILTGKCLFEDEDHLNFVGYWGEGFNGGKSNFLERFEEKYETEDLTDDEKSAINENIKNNFTIEDPDDLKKIYGYLQTLIFYLIKYNCNVEETIVQTIDNLVEIGNINDQNFKSIFNTNGINLQVKKIVSVFLFFEHLCFIIFSGSIKDEYKQEIDENIRNKISEKLMNEKNKNDTKALAASARRFISRYLYRINSQDEFSPKGKLVIQLKRVDLWDKNMRKIEKIEQILDLIKEYDLNVSQSYNFYELIKEEDEKEINAYVEKKEPEIGGQEEPKPAAKPKGKRRKKVIN